MKKLMIALGAAIVAAGVQAATANWEVSNVLIPVASNVKVSETGISVKYGVNEEFPVDALSITLFYLNGDSEWSEITTVANNVAGEFEQDSFWSKSEAAAIRTELGSATTDFRITATYVTADGTYAYEGILADQSFKKAADGSGNSNLYFDMADSDQGSWSYTANAVPEPTSGLLLLLGVAGLALRRRRA